MNQQTETPLTDDSSSIQQPPKATLWPIVGAGAFMVIGILILIYLGRDQSSLLNASLPDLDLAPLVSASDAPTAAELKGQVVVLFFWGEWDAKSKIALPDFYRQYQKFADNDAVRFLCIASEPQETHDRDALTQNVEQFLLSVDIRIPIYADHSMYTRAQIAKSMAAGGFEYPMTIVVDKSGKVRQFWRGHSPSKMDQLEQTIEKLLAEPAND